LFYSETEQSLDCLNCLIGFAAATARRLKCIFMCYSFRYYFAVYLFAIEVQYRFLSIFGIDLLER